MKAANYLSFGLFVGRLLMYMYAVTINLVLLPEAVIVVRKASFCNLDADSFLSNLSIGQVSEILLYH
jgi:hypothetical protein